MKKLLIILMNLFLCVLPLYAHSQVELSLRDLCEKSDNIILARVISTQCYFEEKNKRIFTNIELQILETYKGQLNSLDKITMTVLGGTVNGITTFVLDAPIFRVGEESIMFLSSVLLPSNKKNYTVLGLSQGKFNIFLDSITNVKKIRREQEEIPLRLESNYPPILFRDKDALNLNDFVNSIRKYLI